MTTERSRLEVDGILVEVIRKNIRRLHIGVYPPDGWVRVAAPLRLTADAVRLAVITRLGWIRHHQARFAAQPRQIRRELISGETHYVAGRCYRLAVIEYAGPPAVRTRPPAILELRVRPHTDREAREAILQDWYRQTLQAQLPPLLAEWQPRVGVTVAEARIRRMKTRWGSCNIQARRIWLNLELAKKPPACLEYVLVHELVHLHERQHNARFQAFMDALLPAWRLRRDLLNQTLLAHEDWPA
ncbi:MAG: M48 family metallopeptidase [Candidatus Competibacteraceae bacterium]|nr:M48 family metallopeptidase [Candidatus Competibacteraceae bacterium]